MLAEAAKIEELTNLFRDFVALGIEWRGAISNRHIVVTNGDGVHRFLDEDLDCRETSHHGPDNSLDV